MKTKKKKLKKIKIDLNFTNALGEKIEYKPL